MLRKWYILAISITGIFLVGVLSVNAQQEDLDIPSWVKTNATIEINTTIVKPISICPFLANAIVSVWKITS